MRLLFNSIENKLIFLPLEIHSAECVPFCVSIFNPIIPSICFDDGLKRLYLRRDNWNKISSMQRNVSIEISLGHVVLRPLYPVCLYKHTFCSFILSSSCSMAILKNRKEKLKWKISHSHVFTHLSNGCGVIDTNRYLRKACLEMKMFAH